MSEPRKPIFGFLWATPDPDAPTDAAFRQIRLSRVCRRGPIRILMLAALTLGTIAFVGSAVMAALQSASLLPTFIAAAISATLVFLVLRAWVVGTYVNDAVIRIDTTWRRRAFPLASVTTIIEEHRAPLLGLPVRVRSPRVSIRLADGSIVPTHVYGTSPDLWPSVDSYQISRDLLGRWLPS